MVPPTQGCVARGDGGGGGGGGGVHAIGQPKIAIT